MDLSVVIVTCRWKEECHNIAQKYEIKINELRGEMTVLKKRNNEVTKLLKDSQQKTSQVCLNLYSIIP